MAKLFSLPEKPKAAVAMQVERRLWLMQLLPLVSRKLKYHKYTTITLHRSIKIANYAYPSKM